MAKKGSLRFDLEMDSKTIEYFKNTDALKTARQRAVEAAGMVWADETKEVTQEDDHIDTGLYINSIGYVTHFPAKNKSGKGDRPATEQDVIYELTEEPDITRLKIGSNVDYAEHLEKRYNIMARGLDRSEFRMQKVADVQIKKTLFGK